MTTSRAVETLDEDACWRLLASTDVGRLAVNTPDGPDLFPLNYLVKDHTIYFRSAPGSKLVEITADPLVAFEADGVEDRRRWSVVVRGRATRISFDAEITASGVLELGTMTPSDKWNYVRISPSIVTGRRFSALRHHS